MTAKDRHQRTAVLTIRDPEQLKALADPLRIQILESICEEPKTTKQIADQLGENPTRLYHHVDTLEKAALIRLVETKPKRGTLEKYYGAVARQFRAEVSLGAAPDAGAPPNVAELGAELLETAAAKLRRRSSPLRAGDGLFAHLRIRADARSLTKIRRRVERLLADLGELDESGDEVDTIRLTIALYAESDGDS